jgi:hypothetical protein
MFDASRQMEGNQWVQRNPGDNYAAQNDPALVMPTFSEQANDDLNATTDESQKVSPSGFFYAYDAPGYPKNTVNVPVNEYILQNHGRDFLRVSFNGTRPDGNAAVGSAVSPFVEWWSQISLTTTTVVLNGQPTIMWTRTGSPHANFIDTFRSFSHLGPPFDF